MVTRPPERHELDPIEIASRDEIAALQLARLRGDAAPRLRQRRPLPDDVRPGGRPSRTTSSSSPTSRSSRSRRKDDLRRHYPFGMFAVPREQVVRIHASSGTTGKPTVVGYTRADLEIWAEVCARSIRAAGGRPGDIVHVVYGYGLFTGGLGAHYGAERLGCTVVPMSGGMTERQVQLIADFKPDIIMVTPSYMLAIADEFARQGLDPARLLAAHRHLRRRALDRGDARRDRAALRARRGRHLRPLRGDRPGRRQRVHREQGRPARSGRTTSIPRSSIPATGALLPDGERGELVLTSLTKEAMPVIRYRTRDLTPPAAGHGALDAPHGEASPAAPTTC